MKHKIKKHLPYIILICSLLLTLLIAWPGYMTPDSHAQYSIAKSGLYSDHHPAIMSFLWHYLDLIHEGSGMMLLLHLLLLYGASAYGINIFNNINTLTKINNYFNYISTYFFAIFPLLPIVVIYSCKIWKDVGFAFSFLLTIMMLSNAIAKRRPLDIKEHIIFWLILFYGTCVKFQAQYSTPIVIAGYIIHHGLLIFDQSKFKKLKIILSFLLIYSLFYGIFYYTNNLLVPNEQKSNSWEYVKIYDLAAISFDSNTIYVPKFLHTKHFSSKIFYKIFNHQAVDDMVFPEDAIFTKTKNKQQAKELWKQWAITIVSHPLLYLKHRAINFSYILLLSLPGFHVVNDQLDQKLSPDLISYKIIYYSTKVIGYVIVGHILMAILSIIYLFLGFINLKKTWAAFPLVIFNAVSVNTLFSLFFFSFAWICLKSTLNNKLTST